MVTSPLSALWGAAKGLSTRSSEKHLNPEAAINEIIAYATKARKTSIISLEADLDNIDDPFLRKALSLSVDGTDLQELRKMMELDIARRNTARNPSPKFTKRPAATRPPSASSAPCWG